MILVNHADTVLIPGETSKIKTGFQRSYGFFACSSEQMYAIHLYYLPEILSRCLATNHNAIFAVLVIAMQKGPCPQGLKRYTKPIENVFQQCPAQDGYHRPLDHLTGKNHQVKLPGRKPQGAGSSPYYTEEGIKY